MRVRIRVTPSWKTWGLKAISNLKVSTHLARTIGIGVCLVTGANTTEDLPAATIKQRIAVARNIDPRVARLERFFRSYNCPEPYRIAEYLRAADGYGLDYRLLPAVSIRETTCGVYEKDLNNRWGYHPGRQTFPSIEVGIDYVAKTLAENPAYRGKSLQDKLFTYNPRIKYPVEVQKIMREIE